MPKPKPIRSVIQDESPDTRLDQRFSEEKDSFNDHKDSDLESEGGNYQFEQQQETVGSTYVSF